MSKARALAVLVVLSMTGRSWESRAYVRETTSWTTGTPLRWAGGCIVIGVGDPRSPDLSWDDLMAVTQAAADVWNQGAADCGGVSFVVKRVQASAIGVRADGVNAVVFQSGRYCESGGVQTCDPASLANTTLYFVNQPGAAADGRLYETDIEINGVAYVAGIAPDGGVAALDLQAALTHELGHVFGLDHNCYERMGLPWPVDDRGMQVAACDVAPDDVRASIMYPTSTFTAARRSLSADDVRGACELYAAGTDATCQGGLVPDTGCCSVSSTATSERDAAASMAVLIVVTVVLRRRRSADRGG